VTILDVVQGSPEWQQARLGIPTASCFHRILTARTLKLSSSAMRYKWDLIAERLLGEPMDNADSAFMQRGTALEENACRAYEFTVDAQTSKVGFVMRDDMPAGCSPDRFVGDNGILEIKCASAPLHVGALLDEAGDEYRLQVQGQLWVTGRAWIDLYFYNPDLPPALIRCYPEPAVFKALDETMPLFLQQLDEATVKLGGRSRGHDVENLLRKSLEVVR